MYVHILMLRYVLFCVSKGLPQGQSPIQEILIISKNGSFRINSELILNWTRASDSTDISTLELEANMLSQNNGHQSTNHVEPHPRKTETSTLEKLFL